MASRPALAICTACPPVSAPSAATWSRSPSSRHSRSAPTRARVCSTSTWGRSRCTSSAVYSRRTPRQRGLVSQFPDKLDEVFSSMTAPPPGAIPGTSLNERIVNDRQILIQLFVAMSAIDVPYHRRWTGSSGGETEPQRGDGGLHGLVDHGQQLAVESVQVHLVPQPGREPIHGPDRVIATAVETAVDQVLDPAAQRLEQGGRGQGGGGHGQAARAGGELGDGGHDQQVGHHEEGGDQGVGD